MEKVTNPSIKSIYFWNIAGSFSNALLSVIALMIVTRTLSVFDSDIFSLAWSISQLMATIGTFQVRTFQATDVNGKYTFNQYFTFRVLCLALMMIISLGYVVYLDYDVYKSIIILMICIFRLIDCFADLYEGWFQQKERLDLSGKAQTARIWCCIILLICTLLFTSNLICACFSLILSYLICFIIFDIFVYKIYFKDTKNSEIIIKKNVKKIGNLFIDTFPIFINSFLAMWIFNIPKMSIDSAIDSGILVNGSQSIYNIIFMPASFLTLVYIVFRPQITRMAIKWNERDYEEYIKILSRIFMFLLMFCVPVLIIAYFIGCPVLSLFYGLDLSGNSINLVVILIGGCCYTFACILDNAMVVMRKQYTLLIAYSITAFICFIFSDKLVNLYGISGASIVYLSSMIIFFLIMIVLFVHGYKKNAH